MNLRAAARPTVFGGYAYHARSRNLLGYILVVGLGLFLAGIAFKTAPRPLALALALLFVTIGSWFVKPMVGLCATVYFALVGDIVTSTWFPFTKGFSAQESILFLSKSLILSPMELCLVAAFVALFVRYLVDGHWSMRLGRAGAVVGALGFFVVAGFFYGSLKGGDRHIALFQLRPFVALVAIYVLVTSVCRTSAHFRHLLWTVIAAIETHALISLLYVSHLPAEQLKASEGLVDHGAVMRMNLLLVVVAAAWLFRENSRRIRITTTVLAMPVAVIYMIAQRRAAIIGLIAALALLSVVLYWRQRRTFKFFVPITALVLTAYVGAFWSSQSSAGFPAQAVKSVISPGQVTDRNQSSDLYRIYESYDLNFTIRSNKLLGLGLGQAFYRPAPLPALNASFAFSAYIPHNSILWIWVSFGFGGFVAMFCLFGRTVMLGAGAIREAESGRDLLVLVAFVLYVVIFTVFAAVDIAWDNGNLVLLGASIAAAANYPTRRTRTT